MAARVRQTRSRATTNASEELTPLEIAQRRIRELPQSSHFLDLSGLGLRVVPEELFRLCDLRGLYLSDNELEQLPDHLFHGLQDLSYLDLRNNKLSALPKTLKDAKQLRTLLLGKNRITSLPAELGDIQTLTGLNLAGNPIFFPPEDILEQGVHAVKAFLRARTAALIADPAFVTNPELNDNDDDGNGAEQGQAQKQDAHPHNPFAWEEVVPGGGDDGNEEEQGAQQQHQEQPQQQRRRQEWQRGDSDQDTESVSSALANRLVSNVLDRLAHDLPQNE